MIAIFILLQVAIDCAPPRGQADANRCAFEEYRRADAVLQAQLGRSLAYQRSLDIANHTDQDGMPTWVDALTHSQQTWETYREAQCAWEGLEMRGSARGQLQGECLTSMTRERTEYLKSLDED